MDIKTLKPYLPFIMAFTGGLICALALAPIYFVWAFFVGTSLLFIANELAQSKKAAFFIGWLFGFGYFLIGLKWIGNALLIEGNHYEWAWPLAVAGLPAALAFFYGLALFSAHIALRRASLTSRYIGFVISICLFEWLRGHILTGFPWNLSGSIWASNLEMLQILWPTSIYGLSLLTVFWAGLPALLWLSRNNLQHVRKVVTIGLLSAILAYSYGLYRLQTTHLKSSSDTYVHIVQPNIAQHEKWQNTLMDVHFEKHLRLSTAKADIKRGTHIIIWPETSITQPYLDSEIAQYKIQQVLNTYNGDAHLLTGALRTNETGEYFNSLVHLNKDAAVKNIYDKFHLVPFGEYIPFQRFIPIPTVSQFSGFSKGSGPALMQVSENISVSPLVCYEIIFSGNSIPKNTHPDFIVNVTNDAWYGFSAGPYQHLIQAQFRAIEEGVNVIRAANTGFSALISPLGAIQKTADLFQDATISQIAYERIPRASIDKSVINMLLFAIYCLYFCIFWWLNHTNKRINRQD